MQVQTVFKAGNSNVVAIPKFMSEELGLAKGSKVQLELAVDRKTLLISKAGSARRSLSVTPDFIKILEGVNKRYGSALAELARL
jgi:antitoxin component of MazEF toxin-antitoxin module